MSNFCAAPWRGLHVSTGGDIKTCCAGGMSFGNVATDDIATSLNHPKLKQIRNSIIKGELPDEYCGGCKEKIKKEIKCEMDWHNLLNKDFNLKTTTNNYHYPVIFDARWNNTCNSTCIYCGPTDSSRWESLLGTANKKKTTANKKNINIFLRQYGSNLKTVAMVGGEPLLLNENIEFIDHIPNTASIDVISNFNVDLRKNKLFQKLLTRRKVNWHISFDNVGQQYEYVRQGSNWNLLIKNLKILGELVRNPLEKNDHEIQILAVYGLLNATNICSLKEFAQNALSFFPYKFKNSSIKNIDIVWQDILYPQELNIENYGSDVVQLAIAEIEKYEKTFSNEDEKIFFNNRKTFLKNIKNNTTTKIREQISSFITKKEKLFNNTGTFNKLWPEYSFLIN